MPQSNAKPVRVTSRNHLHWRTIRTYKTVYVSRDGDTITVRSVTPQPKQRTFRSAKGKKRYIAQSRKTRLNEVIIVARTKNRKKAVDDEELEELEGLEELDEDLEDEVDEDEDEDIEDAEEVDDDEDEDEDEDDEEDEEPTPKKRSKGSKTKSTKQSKSRASANGKVGTQEVAEHLGIDGRTLRIVLRKHEIEKDPDSNRYEWSSLNHPVVKRIAKLVASGEAKRAKKEGLDKLKSKKAASKSGSTKSTKTKNKGAKKRKRVVEEDDDE